MNFIAIDTRKALADLDDPRRGVALKRNTAIDLVTALIDFLDDTEGDCDLEPSLLSPGDLEGDGIDDGGWQGEGTDNFDDEPSLAAPEPVYEPVDYWAARRSIVMPAMPFGSQASWCTGTLSDLEDEHNGAEPENEHGPSWSEQSSESGAHVSAFGNEDDENSLGTPEQVDQVRRLLAAPGWAVDDGEDDAGDDREGDDADAEPSLGSPEITADISTAGIGWWSEVGNQVAWAQGFGAMEEETREAEDASGGDILDEPHQFEEGE